VKLVARPFCIEGFRDLEGERGGVLLIHGFTGSPHEMRPLLEPLRARGFAVLGVRLPGHGFPIEREDVASRAWQAAVDAALDELRDRHPGYRVAICGLSMGALLALAAASRRPADVAALALLSPAIMLRTAASRLLGAARWIGPLGVRYRLAKPKGTSDIRDEAARVSHPGCDPFPISAFLSFDALRRTTRTVVRRVHQPSLIVHAAGDRTCMLAGAEWLGRELASSAVEMHVLRESGHVITVDRERDTVAQLVCDFFERSLGATARPPGFVP
jgi:carboxylesterase